MARIGKKLILALAALSVLLGVPVFFLLSGYDAGTGYFQTALLETMSSLSGWSISAETVSGNPVVGYSAENVRLSFEEEETARAESLAVKLSLLSLLRGSVKVDKLSLTGASVSTEKLFSAVRRTDLPESSGGMPFLPVVVFSPVELATPLGNLSLDLLRLSPGKGTATIEGRGSFLGTRVEIGGSLAADSTVYLTGGFLKAGSTSVSLSGEVSPEIFLEGIVNDLVLEKAAVFFSLPFTAKGTVNSTLTVSRPGGKLLVSGEGDITGGDIWDLLMEGRFTWSADDEKATLSPLDGRVFSSPAGGNFSVFFGERPYAEIKLGLKDVDFDEWTRFFPWLSFGKGKLSSLKTDLEGPFDQLSGPVSFSSQGNVVLEGFSVADLKGNVVLSKGNSIDLNAAGKWEGSPFTANGKVHILETGKTSTKVSVSSDKLNLKSAGTSFAPGLSLSGNARGDLQLEYPPEGKMTLAGKFSAQKFSVWGIQPENLSLSFSGTAETIAVSAFSMSLPGGGTLSGEGGLSGLTGKTPKISLDGEGKNIRWSFVESLADGEKPLGAEGLFDLKWSVKSPLASPAAEFDLRGRNTDLSKTLPLRNISLRGQVSGNDLVLSGGSAELWGGKTGFSGKTSFGESPSIAVKGTFTGLSLKQAAPQFDLAAGKASGTLSGEFSLSGKTRSPVLSLSAKGSPDLSVEGISVSTFTGKAEGNLPKLRVSASAKVFDSPVSAGGTIEPGGGGKTDISVSFGKIDLRKLSEAFFPGAGLGGTIDGKLALVTGGKGKLSAVFTGTSPLVTFHGMLAEKVKASVKPDGKDAFSIDAEGTLGKSTVSVTGKLAFTRAGTEISLRNSKKIDIAATAAGLSSQAAGNFTGKADFDAKGVIGEKGYSWTGKITSPLLGFYRTEAKDVTVPFTWKNGAVEIRNGKVDYYGGAGTFSGKVDPKTMRWEGNLTVKGMDMEGATKRLLGGQGKVAGKADLTARGTGTGGMVGMVFGSGQLSAKEGSVSGFSALKSVSNSGEIRFSSILASFNLDGRNIFLMPGSRVSAPVGDNVYRYFSASGSLGWNDSPVDLKCTGDINVRALNAFLGALQGILAVDGNPLTDPAFLQNFLSGLLGGMSVKDFRETSFNVKGTWDSPLLTDIKVTSNSPAASFSRPNGSSGKDETKIKITLEIPTGEGKNTSPSTEDQMKKQLLENIMKQIIRPGESSQE